MRKPFAFVPFITLAAIASADTLILPHILETSGRIVGVCEDARGGQAKVQPATGPTVARPGFDQLRLTFTPSSNPDLMNFVTNVYHGAFETSLTVFGYTNGGGLDRMRVKTSYVSEVEFPPMDAAATEPDFMKMKMALESAELIDRVAAQPTPAHRDAAMAQKKWLPCNFRLRIGNLPTARVNKIEALTIKQKRIEHGTGVAEHVQDMAPLAFTLPMQDAGPFQEWFDATASGKGFELPVSLIYMDGDLPMFEVSMMATIESLGPELYFDRYEEGKSVREITDKMEKLALVRVEIKSARDENVSLRSLLGAK